MARKDGSKVWEVTLKIQFIEEDEHYETDPRTWNWTELLDLHPDSLIDVTAVPVTDPMACPGCGCMPGDGRTPGCTHPEGCGYNG